MKQIMIDKRGCQPAFLFFLLIFPLALFAQPPALGWVTQAGPGGGFDHVNELVLESDKAVIAGGNFKGTIDFDAGPGIYNLTAADSYDFFITKYTSRGNFIWARSIGGLKDDDLRDLKKDRDGNLYVAGIFQSTVDFDPGPNLFYAAPEVNGANTFILKLDKDGNFLWVKTLNFLSQHLEIDDDGNIFLSGDFINTKDFDPGPGVYNMTASALAGASTDMFIMKLDNLGNFSWAKQLRSLQANSYQQGGLETDPDGNVFLAGNFTNSIDFDPGPATVALISAGSDDAFILKLNAQGNYIWVKQFGSTSIDKAFGLEVDRDGNVFSTGIFSLTVDFDPGTVSFPLTSAGIINTFISKLDGAGNFIYAKAFQKVETFGFEISIDSSNNTYIAGTFYGTVDFDPGPSTYNITGGPFYNVKLNSAGDFVWAAAYNSISSTLISSVYSAMKVDSTGSVYFGSTFGGTIDFDPGPNTFTLSTSGPGDADLFFLKLGTASCNNSTGRIINAQSCGNYILNGVSYNRTGQYYQLLSNASGCDSILQLNLTVTNIQTNQVLSSCNPVVWNGKTLSTTGVYRDTIRLANGCDSIIMLTLTVNSKPVPNLGRDTALCTGDTVRLSAGTFASYLWSNGSTASSIAATQTGIYWLHVTAANGCSARDSLNIAPSNNCTLCTDPKVVEKIYPVPFSSKLTVKLKSSVCELKMDLYNNLGQLVIQGRILQPGTNTIDLEKLPAAAYFYRIYNGNIILTKGKILKQ